MQPNFGINDKQGQTSAATRRLVDATGLWCALGYAALAWLARQSGEPELPAFFLFAVWTGLPVFGLFFILCRRGEPLPIGRLLLWAVAFRLCGLIGGPFYEDDFYRFLWDGYQFAVAGSPYGVAPEAFFIDPAVPEAFQRILDKINNPELPTIYAPVTQLVFLLAFLLAPGSILGLQVLLVLIDLAVVALLIRLAPPRNVMLYAWCPLVVKEIAFTAHPDGIGVCLLLAALVLARNRLWPAAALCLGAAVGAKVFALVLAPFVLLGAKFRHWALFGATLMLLYAPFLVLGDTHIPSLLLFAQQWEFNSFLFGPVSMVLPPLEAKALLGLIFAALWIGCYFQYYRGDRPYPPRGDWLYGLLLATSAVINPWYLLWVLPFAAVFPSAWAWTASLAVLLSYITGLNLGDYDLQSYQQPVWVRPVEFGLILMALAWDGLHRRRAGRETGKSTQCTKA